MKAVEAGVIEAVVKAIDMHIDNVDMCKWGHCALLNIIRSSKR